MQIARLGLTNHLLNKLFSATRASDLIHRLHEGGQIIQEKKITRISPGRSLTPELVQTQWVRAINPGAYILSR